LTVMLIGTWLSLVPAFAAEVEGVKFEERTRASTGGPELVLNGAGVRRRFFVKVYVGALYLQEKGADANHAIGHRGLKRMSMHMLRGLGSDQLFLALRDGLENNHAEVQVASLEPQIRRLREMFDIGRALEKGDVVHLDMVPGTGTRVIVNGESRGTLPGDEIGRALLRIWLGENPADDGLKQALLGG